MRSCWSCLSSLSRRPSLDKSWNIPCRGICKNPEVVARRLPLTPGRASPGRPALTPGGGVPLRHGLQSSGPPPRPPGRGTAQRHLCSEEAAAPGQPGGCKAALTNSCLGHAPVPADGDGYLTAHLSARPPGRPTSPQSAWLSVRHTHLAPAHNAPPRPKASLQRLRHASPVPLGVVPCVLRGVERCAPVRHSVLSP